MLLDVIGDTPSNRVIDFLIEGLGISYSKKDMADGCEISRPTIYKLLPVLIKEGIIIEQPNKIGNITLYSLNKNNEKIQVLLKLEEVLLNRSFEGIEKRIVASLPS